MAELHERFATAIRGMRENQDLSLQEVADRSGLSKSHVWELEHNRATNPTISTLLALCRGFGCEPGNLLTEFGGAPPLHPLAMRVAVDVDMAFRKAERG